MLKSYNDLIQAQNRLWFWCNSCGEVNMPGSEAVEDKELLPAPVRKLYEQFQGDFELPVYTVTVDGQFGMGIDVTYFPSELRDSKIGAAMSADPKTFDAQFHFAVESVARELDENANERYEAFYGEDTDPEGDELFVFVPSHMIMYNDGTPYMANDSETVFSYLVHQVYKTAYGDVFTTAVNNAVAAAKWFAVDREDLT